MYAVGIDLGGTAIKGALVKLGEGLIHEVKTATQGEHGPEHVLDRIAYVVKELQTAAPEPVAGVGIGAPGAIDWARTTVIYPPNLPGWERVNLREALQARCGADLAVFVENDANLAGLGSAHYGAGRPHDSFIMITLGTGVGGAIIYDNRIFRGTTGAAGEIGHMSIDFSGPFDRYGIAGAIEAYIGQRFLSHHARYRLLGRYDSKVHDLPDVGDDLEHLTPRMIHDAAQDGDEDARHMLAWAGHKLGCVLASCANLLDIPKVVVGGGVSHAGDFILGPAREAMAEYVMPMHRERIEIIRETQGNDVGMLGAAHLVFQSLDDERSVGRPLQA